MGVSLNPSVAGVDGGPCRVLFGGFLWSFRPYSGCLQFGLELRVAYQEEIAPMLRSNAQRELHGTPSCVLQDSKRTDLSLQVPAFGVLESILGPLCMESPRSLPLACLHFSHCLQSLLARVRPVLGHSRLQHLCFASRFKASEEDLSNANLQKFSPYLKSLSILGPGDLK